MATYLLLARHGKAEDGPDDFARRLTDKGRDQVLRVASLLKRAGVEVDVIEHSGLVRAAETAEIFSQKLKAPTVQREGLTSEADPQALAWRLTAAGERRIMVVSHAPLLPELASYLLTGSEDQEPLHFRTGTVACLALDSGRWSVEWMLPPAMAV